MDLSESCSPCRAKEEQDEPEIFFQVGIQGPLGIGGHPGQDGTLYISGTGTGTGTLAGTLTGHACKLGKGHLPFATFAS